MWNTPGPSTKSLIDCRTLPKVACWSRMSPLMVKRKLSAWADATGIARAQTPRRPAVAFAADNNRVIF
jgi:hypothetical protein